MYSNRMGNAVLAFPITKYNNPKVFNAGIDTTFAVYNKNLLVTVL